MKAMRYLLITFAVMMVLSLNAQSLAQQPSADFHSTSSMVGAGSALPQAVQTGAYTTYDAGYNPSRANKPGIRRDENPGGGFNPGGGDGEPDDREEMWKDPIGDGLWALVALAACYAAFAAWRKRKNVAAQR